MLRTSQQSVIKKVKYLIIGAGPAGLGAGWHLQQKRIKGWLILEKESYPGGLSASFKDKKGFFWDLGGHVIFDNNSDLAKLAKELLKSKLVKHKRKAAIFLKGKYIPYPFQDNLHFLSPKIYQKILTEQANRGSTSDCLVGKVNLDINFRKWLYMTFGKTLSELFFVPQNEKSWVYPLEKMSCDWIAKRIKLPNLASKSWGANASFYYPEEGGIGAVFHQIADQLKDKIRYNTKITKINYRKKEIVLSNKKTINYQYLISTMPLDLLFELVERSKLYCSSKRSASRTIRKLPLDHNRGLIIGLGIKGKLRNNYHWLYYPEKKYSFFRLVFPSNSSSFPKNNCSVIVEIALGKKPYTNKIIKQIEDLALFEGKIISVFEKEVKYFYPIPTLNRDKILNKTQSFLNRKQVYSIGRFGGWKYEQGNMDDAFGEGKLLLDKFL